jgi:nitrogen regulatory protein PII
MNRIMLVVNLHEIDFLEETLTALRHAQVRDCTVQEVEGVASYHPGDDMEPSTLSSIAGMFKRQRNVNYLIVAVTEEGRMEQISTVLKKFYKEDRYACSFWFVPVMDYWYHKARD